MQHCKSTVLVTLYSSRDLILLDNARALETQNTFIWGFCRGVDFVLGMLCPRGVLSRRVSRSCYQRIGI